MNYTFLFFRNIPHGPGEFNTSTYTIEILLMLLLAALLGYLFRHFLNNRKYNELKNNIAILNQKNTTLENELGKINSDYTNLDSKYKILSSQEDDRDQELLVLNSRLRLKENEIDEKSTDLDKWNDKEKAYKRSIDTLKSQLSESKNAIDSFQLSKKTKPSPSKTVKVEKATKAAPTKTVKKKVSTAKVKSHPFAKLKNTDLKIVEGVGPKIESILKDAGIKNWSDLSQSSVDKIQQVLSNAGPRYKLAVPKTWPNQASLAHEKKWKELEEYQDFLEGGKDFTS